MFDHVMRKLSPKEVFKKRKLAEEKALGLKTIGVSAETNQRMADEWARVNVCFCVCTLAPLLLEKRAGI